MIPLLVIQGNLGKDAKCEVYNGKKVLRLNVATKCSGKDEEDPIWWKISMWDYNYTQRFLDCFTKGSNIRAVCQLKRPRIYDGKVYLEGNAKLIELVPSQKSRENTEDAEDLTNILGV